MNIRLKLLRNILILLVVSTAHRSCHATYSKIHALTSLCMGTSFHHSYYGYECDDQIVLNMVHEIKQLLGIPSARSVHVLYLNEVGYAHFGVENLIATSNAIFIDREWFATLPFDQQRFLIAHELAHIKNKDVSTMITLVGCAGALIGYFLYWQIRNKKATPYPFLLGAALAIIVPSYGRYIEERADCNAAYALQTVEGGIACITEWQAYDIENGNMTWWQRFIDDVFATHPSHAQRIEALTHKRTNS